MQHRFAGSPPTVPTGPLRSTRKCTRCTARDILRSEDNSSGGYAGIDYERRGSGRAVFEDRFRSRVRRDADRRTAGEAEEVRAFIHRDVKQLAGLWSSDTIVTNPLNKLVTKQQVLGMVQSGFLAIPGYDRQIDYLREHGDIVIVAGRETVLWGGRMPNAGRPNVSGSRASG
jgi:uncharacterized protein DUF4440